MNFRSIELEKSGCQGQAWMLGTYNNVLSCFQQKKKKALFFLNISFLFKSSDTLLSLRSLHEFKIHHSGN